MNSRELFEKFEDCPVLVTGHSGFKGSWLTTWLSRLGARVVGVSLPPDQGVHNIYDRGRIADACRTHWLDIRDAGAMRQIVEETKPRVVFHLAAQPLVQRSYREPLETFSTNIIGGANVLEAARLSDHVKAFVFVTSDKVYQNNEWCWAYRENDRLGGLDPYSASKSAAEIIAKTYMTVLHGGGEGFRLATARGGNVIGGGDWAEDRIVPDIVRALHAGKPLALRHPGATRPWQHVLELCAGYMTLAARLLDGWPDRSKPASSFVGSYNFGPDRTSEMSVRSLADAAVSTWGGTPLDMQQTVTSVHEATYLRVDSSKAQAELGWSPQLAFDETVAWTIDWYKRYLTDPTCAPALMAEQISAYVDLTMGNRV